MQYYIHPLIHVYHITQMAELSKTSYFPTSTAMPRSAISIYTISPWHFLHNYYMNAQNQCMPSDICLLHFQKQHLLFSSTSFLVSSFHRHVSLHWNRKLNLCHLFMQGINFDQRSILRVTIKSPTFWAHRFVPRDVIKTDIWTTASRNYTNNLCCLDCYNLPANIWPRSQL